MIELIKELSKAQLCGDKNYPELIISKDALIDNSYLAFRVVYNISNQPKDCIYMDHDVSVDYQVIVGTHDTYFNGTTYTVSDFIKQYDLTSMKDYILNIFENIYDISKPNDDIFDELNKSYINRDFGKTGISNEVLKN